MTQLAINELQNAERAPSRAERRSRLSSGAFGFLGVAGFALCFALSFVFDGVMNVLGTVVLLVGCTVHVAVTRDA